MTLVQNAEEATLVQPADPSRLAFITQTTLSVDDTAEIIDVLRARFPDIEGPKREDICYATTNRQAAVKAVATDCDLVIVIGSPNSSNSQRLREVAERAGARRAILLPKAEALDWAELDGVQTLGLTAGASAPETLVQATLVRLSERYNLHIDERRVTQEDVAASASAHPRSPDRPAGYAESDGRLYRGLGRCAELLPPEYDLGTWSPSAASPRGSRTATSRCAPPRATSSSRCTRSAWTQPTCPGSSA